MHCSVAQMECALNLARLSSKTGSFGAVGEDDAQNEHSCWVKQPEYSVRGNVRTACQKAPPSFAFLLLAASSVVEDAYFEPSTHCSSHHLGQGLLA